MKKYLKGIFTACAFCSVFIITSCHNMCADLEKTIGAVCWIDKLEWVDVSSKSVKITIKDAAFASSAGDLEIYSKTSSTSGNWGLSSFGRDIKGFDANVKLTSGITWAGFELYSTDNYCKYVFQIRNNKEVHVYYQSDKKESKPEYICKIKNAVEDPYAFNNIKLEIQKDRSSKVYVNGQYICTISDHNIHYGGFYCAFHKTSGNVSAYYTFNKIQH